MTTDGTGAATRPPFASEPGASDPGGGRLDRWSRRSATVPFRVKVALVWVVIFTGLAFLFWAADFDNDWIRENIWFIARGLVFTLLKNISPTTAETRIPMVAAGPKPRVVTLLVSPAGEDSFMIGSSARKATHYVVKIKIGGIAGVVAPLIGKQPPDSHVWIMQGDAPAFVKSEGPLAPDGPVWRIELASPTWPEKPQPR